MTRVCIHGMVVDTPVPLPAGPVPPGLAGRADLVIRVIRDVALPVDDPASGESLASARDDERGQHYRLSRSAAGGQLVFPGKVVVLFEARGPSVEVRVAPGVTSELLTVLLGGPALAAIAMARGAGLLHASAVTWSADRDCPDLVLLAGPPGSGKSLVARLLCRGPRELFSDDAVAVELNPGALPLGHRGTVESRLRGDWSSRLGLVDEAVGATGRSRRSADNRALVRTATASPATGRVRAVLIPRLSPDVRDIALGEPSAVAVTLMLATSWPVSGVVDPALAQRQLDLAAGLVAAVPVRILELPWPRAATDPRLPDVIGELLDLAQPAATESRW